MKFSFCFAFFSIVSFNSSNLLLIFWSFSSQSSGRANVSLALKYQTPGPVAFTLNGSRLVTTRKLNFETQDSYKVTVVATDSGNPPLNTSLTFTIQVKKTLHRHFQILCTRNRQVPYRVSPQSRSSTYGELVIGICKVSVYYRGK